MCLLLVGDLVFTTNLNAQEELRWTNFDYVKNSNSWLSGENATGLSKLNTKSISFIETAFYKKAGDFINFYESDNSSTFGAKTESFYRLSKIVFYGKMEYSNFSGKNMGGSTLLDPYFSSFDIVEFADSTAGKKNMETYHLTGAFSVPLYKKLLLGLKANYKTVSYYKVKDLRHTNDLMNLESTVGLSYSLGEFAEIGSNFYFKKRVENTLYQAEGNTDQQFNSLISYGSFFGKQETFGTEGYTGDDNNNPFVDYIHGISFQIDLFPKSKIHFFNEIGLKWRKGYFGEKSSVDIQYTEHQADIIHYKGVISFEKLKNLHQLFINVNREDLVNFENSYNESTTSGGNTTVVYYGKNEVLDRVLSKAKLTYTGNINVRNDNPEYVIIAGASIWRRDQISTFYPYYRIQDIKQLSANASLEKNIIRNNNMYSICVEASYGSGNGSEKTDGSYAQASKGYASLNKNLYKEYEYLTAARGIGGFSFRYTKALPEGFRFYGEINYDYTKAFDVSFNGNSFSSLSVKIGYLF